MNASSDAASEAPLSKEEINDLPMLAYEGEVMLVQTEGEMARALNFLKKETLLGFDTESRPSFKKGKSYPTSLIQLAGSELVVLIRLNHTPFSESLAEAARIDGCSRAGTFFRIIVPLSTPAFATLAMTSPVVPSIARATQPPTTAFVSLPARFTVSPSKSWFTQHEPARCARGCRSQ